MIRVINSENEVTHYSRKFYYVEHTKDGTKILKCKADNKSIAEIIPVGFDNKKNERIEIFKEVQNFINLSKN